MDYQQIDIPVIANETIYITKGFTSGIDESSVLKQNRLLITAETPSSKIKSAKDSRINAQSVVVAKGAQHADAFMGILHNWSTDGDGNTAFYGKAVSMPGAMWSAAIHGETRHAGGTSIAGNFELQNYSVLGDSYGVVINNTTGLSGEIHEVTKQLQKPTINTTALYVTGSDYSTGLKLDANFTSGKAIDIKAGSIYLGGKQVIGERVNGFKPVTTVTANDFNNLVNALKAHGLIGE